MEIPSLAPAVAGSGSPGLGQQQTPPKDRRPAWPYKTDAHIYKYVQSHTSRQTCLETCTLRDSHPDISIHRKIISIIITNIYYMNLSTLQISTSLLLSTTLGSGITPGLHIRKLKHRG